MRFRPRTVRRLAERACRDELKLGWRERARETAAATPTRLGRAPVVLVVPPAVAITLLFIPKPFSFEAFEDPVDAQTFLSTLWQVEAGTIALSLSVILVAFETIWRRRFRGTVRGFVDEVFLLYALSAAFASLLVIGCALLGWGTNAPGGWAATWATIVSAAAVSAIPIVLILTLRLMNPATLHKRRLNQLRAEVYAAVDEEAFERLAVGVLKEAVKDAPGIELTPVLDWEDRGDKLPITASRNGVVRDIRIGRLLRIAGRLSSRAPAAITVGARLRASVSRDTELAQITPRANRWQRWRIRKAFKVDPNAEPPRLFDVISQLHQEALRALRDVEPSTYEDVCELWIELLLALPEAWMRYVEMFDERVSGSSRRFFGFGPVDSVSRNLFIEARESTKSMHDLAAPAYDLPEVVLMRSVDLDAPALVKRMLAIYVDLYDVTAELEDERLRERLFNFVFNAPKQFAQFVEHDFRDHDAPVRKRQRANRNLHLCFQTFMEQMKAAADHDPADTARIARINSGWADIFSGWFPEHEKEEDLGLDEDEVSRNRELNARIDAVIAQKNTLERLRDAYRFAIAYWALHQLVTTRNTDWRGVIALILPWLGDPERLAAEVDQVISIDRDDSTFTRWHDSTVQIGWAGPRAFIVFSLLQYSPDQIPVNVGRRTFLRHGMQVEIEELLDAVAADEQLWELLGGRPEDLPMRIEALRNAIRASAALP